MFLLDDWDTDYDFIFFGDNNGDVWMLLLSEEMAEASQEELALCFKYQYCKR